MNQLINALNKHDNQTTTLNGAKAFKSTNSACLNLFSSWGGARGQNILPLFTKAYAENKELATRIILWGRDVRSGAGERKLFRDCFMNMAFNDYIQAGKMLHKVPELGRWDDLLDVLNTPVGHNAIQEIEKGLKEHNGLCGKWMPRKGSQAITIRKALGLTPKAYRKMIVSLSKTVEQQMCAQQWSEINYEHVPSQAMQLYKMAFKRHDQLRFDAFKNKVVKGEAKINAGAIYPHEILINVEKDSVLCDIQWKAQKDWIKEGLNFLPVIDVSGSMGYFGSGVKNSPINIAIGLGLYLAERNKGPFKDSFISFSETPEFITTKGSLSNRVEQINKSKWEMNTNIQAVFELVLSQAVKHKVPQSDLPTHIIIISDMQFDRCAKGNNVKEIQQRYKAAGYNVPVLVFWNVQDYGNKPVKQHKENTILISGYSPSIMESLLTSTEVTPYDQMLATIMQERYNY